MTKVVKVLPKFKGLSTNTDDIIFLWGGRDYGKSYYLATLAVLKLCSPEYFRLILVRKTYNTIKDSQWQLMKDVSTTLGLYDQLEFVKSPLEVRHKTSSNTAMARGCDAPEKLKSIANPSHVWYEEGNQLSLEDHTTITTSLRNNSVKVQEWFSFNPETNGDYRDFWLWKNYFSHTTELSFSHKKVIEVGEETLEINYTSVHGTYVDNKYCTPERRARHEQLKESDPYRYQVYTKGLWGNEKNDNPFFHAFKEEHILKGIEQVELDENYPVWLSFDFNTKPMTCIVLQLINEENGGIFIVDEYQQDGTVGEMCEMLKGVLDFDRFHFYVTGDATGGNPHSSMAKLENGNFNDCYEQIKRSLGVTDSNIVVSSANKVHELSRQIINQALYSGIVLFNERCKQTISDFRNAKPTSAGKLYKNREKGHANDALDAGRYGIDALLPEGDRSIQAIKSRII